MSFTPYHSSRNYLHTAHVAKCTDFKLLHSRTVLPPYGLNKSEHIKWTGMILACSEFHSIPKVPRHFYYYYYYTSINNTCPVRGWIISHCPSPIGLFLKPHAHQDQLELAPPCTVLFLFYSPSTQNMSPFQHWPLFMVFASSVVLVCQFSEGMD